MGVERLAASLTRLRDALAEVRLPLDVPGAEEGRELVRAQGGQIEDYVLPRLRRLDAPLLAVVGGSTGAGKSTLVNTLIGRVVSEAGVIRPTTRSSVLVHHPQDARWFSSSQILPGLARSDSAGADPRVLQLIPEPSLPRGLAILDAPDVDSVVAQNRTLAAQLLAAADLWLFVTSAARYADAVPWRYLRSAARRKAVVAVVLDRVPPAAMSEVPPHLGQMMSQRGLGASPLFAVPETEVDSTGLLPNAATGPIRGWLASLAEDTFRRNQVVLQTLDGAIESLAERTPEIAKAIEDQSEAIQTLRADAEKSFAEATRAVAAQTADGTLLRGEVLARWQDFVGTGEFFRAVEKRIGLLRDRMIRVAKGEPKKAQEVQLAVESGLEVLIREEGEFAARRVVSAWEAHPAGRQLLAQDGALGKVAPDFGEYATRVIRDWQGDVLELVGGEGKSKKATARYLALGVNGAGVALMVFVFSQTGGLLGAEIGVAGGTAILAQRVLEAVFGEDAVRRLAKQAKLQLDSRVEALMAGELARFERLLDEAAVDQEQAVQLTAAVAALNSERIDEDRYVREVSPAGSLPPADAEGLAADDAQAQAEMAPISEDRGAPSEEFAETEVDADSSDADLDAPEHLEDTGLLPKLVADQLSALAADVSRRADSDEREEAVAESSDSASAARPDLGRSDEDQAGSQDPGFGLGSESEAAGNSELTVGERYFAEADPKPDSGEGRTKAESITVVGVEPDHQPEPAPIDPDWRIPVPRGLAELAAEAVRRPSAHSDADLAGQHSGLEPAMPDAEEFADVQMAEAATQHGLPQPDEAVQPASRASSPSSPGLPQPPELATPGLASPEVLSDAGEPEEAPIVPLVGASAMPDGPPAEPTAAGEDASPAFALPAAPPAAPLPVAPGNPGDDPGVGVSPPSPPAAHVASRAYGVGEPPVPGLTLAPPAQTPPPPPVPSWPAPEADQPTGPQE